MNKESPELTLEEKSLIQKLLPFTAHRIELKKGLFTKAEGGKDALTDFRFQQLLKRTNGSFNGKRVLDVGCLEGGYTMAAAKFGALEAVGVEARKLNFERCMLVSNFLKLDNLNFYHANVKDIKKLNIGKFDIIICSGLLYHLEDPFLFLKQMNEILNPNGLIMIDTHVALENEVGHRCEELVTENFDKHSYKGRWAFEYKENSSENEIENFLWASFGNRKSFWPLEKFLKQMLHDCGFDNITKIERDISNQKCKQGHKNCRVGYIVKKIKDL